MPIPIPSVYRLKFVNQPGIEVVCKSTSMGRLLRLAQMGVHQQDEKATKKALGYFSKRIIEWNVDHPEIEEEYEGEEITDACNDCGLEAGARLPLTAAGLMCAPIDFIQLMIASWMNAVSRVSLPKDESYSNGGSDTGTQTSQLGSLQSPISSEMLS